MVCRIFIFMEDNRVQIRLNIASYMDSHHVQKGSLLMNMCQQHHKLAQVADYFYFRSHPSSVMLMLLVKFFFFMIKVLQ